MTVRSLLNRSSANPEQNGGLRNAIAPKEPSCLEPCQQHQMMVSVTAGFPHVARSTHVPAAGIWESTRGNASPTGDDFVVAFKPSFLSPASA